MKVTPCSPIPKGSHGPRGLPGGKGSTGNTGAEGPQGPKGSKGDGGKPGEKVSKPPEFIPVSGSYELRQPHVKSILTNDNELKKT